MKDNNSIPEVPESKSSSRLLITGTTLATMLVIYTWVSIFANRWCWGLRWFRFADTLTVKYYTIKSSENLDITDEVRLLNTSLILKDGNVHKNHHL